MSDLQRLLSVLLMACSGLALSACGPDGSASQPPVVHTYDVRGVVRQLPRPDAPQRELWLHHESITDFVDISGKVKGMDSMTMPFIPAPDLSLENLVVGDKVAFKLQVDWQATPPATVTTIEKLPADALLEWEEP
jgi:Cu/Ag efflux protein CusF